MKKCLMLLVVIVLLSPAAKAQPPVGYIGLFTDAGHSSWCAYGTTPYYPVTMYIWCLPSVNGQMCAEFAVDYTADPGIIKTAVTPAAHVSVALGSLEAGMSVCFIECQTEWHYAFTQALFINTSSKLTLQIIPNPVVEPVPLYQFANCLPKFPTEPCIVFTNLYINYQNGVDAECSTTATETASWGAIKNIYQD